LHTKEIDLGLERIQKIYQKLFPQGVLFKVITVAGTIGKGSTIASILVTY
jgi:dihydrofolate synthase/folylpolyglutamate synthase